MIVHVCWDDGQRIGEFEEADFRDKIFAGELQLDNFYWYEGMADWRPIAEYRALAKTQRIKIDPPTESEAMPSEAPRMAPARSGYIGQAAIICVIALIITVFGVASGSRIVGGLGALLLLAGAGMAVFGRLRS